VLYTFNLIAFLVCAFIVFGQLMAWDTFDVTSPELVVRSTPTFTANCSSLDAARCYSACVQ
jgi:hypothetical protein